VKLSLGNCVRGGIQCHYHGWIFDGRGNCIHIPSEIGGDDLTTRGISIPSFLVREQQGTIWFSFSRDPFDATPPDWYFFEKKSFTTILEMDCEYTRFMENLVDDPHAGYLHGGLLRGKPTTDIVGHIRETPLGVHIKTVGEKARSSLLYQVFGKKDQEIEHSQEFIVPDIVRTLFSHPGGTHVSSQFVCVPVNEKQTRAFYRVTLDFPFSQLLMPFFKAMVDRVMFQDKIMLEHEARQEWACPDYKKSLVCKSDIASIWVSSAAKAYAKNGPEHKEKLKHVEAGYRL
jgi:phenylpropionate dioxygenase-like ring-hydroxylating dioxygenase large terminal subunit